MLRRLADLTFGTLWPGWGKRRFVFIVTYARSGSTVLQNILARLPSAHINGENNDVLGGMFRSWRSAAQTRDEQGDLPRSPAGDPWRGAHFIEPMRFNRRMARLFIEEILRPPRSARLIGFKEVRYFDYGPELPAYLDYLRMSFKPALLIFNRRSGPDVAQSAWWREHPADVAAEVAAFDAITDAYARAHPDQTIIVDYDVWTRDPGTLRPLFQRLGVAFDLAFVQRILDERLDH